ESTSELATPASDLQAPGTAPLFKQAIEEMMLTRKVLTEQGGQVLERLTRVEERLDRFENEIRKEMRTLGNRLDLVVIEISKIQAQGRDLEQRVTELEQKPA
ncbi:MAG: hypothetical protein KF868_21970, partial [Acidobacteria bacterium]|nr:hypothetical protein [Acidobacteriota bacterium]